MSKGSPIVNIRVQPGLLAQVDARCERSVTHCKVPMDRTAFITAAIVDKLDHYKRSSRKGCNTPRRKNTIQWRGVADTLPDAETTVMLYSPEADEPIWPGFHDGEGGWVWAEGIPAKGVTHWAQIPEPPEVKS